MADKQGILTREQENQIAELLDQKVVFKNKILEAIDKTVFKAVVSIVDDYGLEKLNEKYKIHMDELADHLLQKEYQKAVLIIWDLASLIVKEFISE